MEHHEASVGVRVRALRAFVGVPAGAEGVIDEDYGSGVMVAWDLPACPLPAGYAAYDGRPALGWGLLRDGFDKGHDLRHLERVAG